MEESDQALPDTTIHASGTIGLVSSQSTNAVPPRDLDPYRLDRTTIPDRYDVCLWPDLDQATFEGTVDIEITVTEPVETLVLNAIELEIDEVTVDEQPASAHLDPDHERLFITCGSPLEIGPHRVSIRFRGTLNDKLRGFYRSTYTDSSGQVRVIATTQMQSTDCRRAFPCWDEPDFKAVFGISVVIEDGLLAISNGPEIERRTIDDRGTAKTLIRFADTMVMSTYLVALVVGPLEATEPIEVDGIDLRIVHVPGKGDLTGFGLEVAAFSLRWFREYYGIDYPGLKLDLVALPDFAAGAMENLGCVTFRENVLLVDPERSTQAEQQLVADVVAHELAHMWFGDLVTMAWWNGIWLNEAFATFMEIAACDAFRPDWQRWTTFGLERSVAFDTDSLSSTRSVEYEVRSPADCEGMFDVLTYQKGAALLRMLEQYLGPEQFRAGVAHYLRTHSYGNTETADLWDALESTSGEPVRRLMDSWIWQPGYPLITAELDGDELVLSQQRFGFDPTYRDSTRWVVPILIGNGGRQPQSVLLDGDQTRLPLADPEAAVIVNAGGHGFYRVRYDETLRTRLGAATLASLDTLERYSIVDDAWNGVVAGQLSAADFVELIEGYADERDYAVWQIIIIAARGLGRLIDGPARQAFAARLAALLEPIVTELGDPVEGEDDLRAKLRGLLLGALAILGEHEPSRERCRAIFQHPHQADPELVATATAVVAATGDHGVYDQLLEQYRSAATPQDQLRNLHALAEFDQADLIQRTCELAFTDEVKTQNAPFLLRMCIANRNHGWLAWGLVRNRWQEAVDRFPSNTIVRMIDSVKLLNLPEQQAEVAAFFEEHPIPQAAETLRQVLERQLVNTALRNREHEPFSRWLES